MSKFTSGGDVKLLLKVVECDGDLSSLIVRVEAIVVSNDNEVGEELVDEFRVVGIVVYDDKDECRVDEKL